MTTDTFYSKPTQVFWTCKALLDGRTISHRTEIREVRGWRLGAIIHRLKTEYAWPIQTTYSTTDNVAFYSLKADVGRHVQLPEGLQASEAWATLIPGPRALYIELKRRFNGVNNGRIILSHREAAKALGVHRNTVGPWFEELEARRFIRATQGHHLGPAGIGQSAHWALEEMPCDDLKSAPKSFMAWRQKQNPRTKNRTLRHRKQDTSGESGALISQTVLKIVT